MKGILMFAQSMQTLSAPDTLTGILTAIWWVPLGVIVAIIVPFIVWWLASTRRGFSCVYLERTNLLNTLSNGPVKLFIGEREITQASEFKIEFANIGNVPIQMTDWEAPLQLDFGPDSEVVWAAFGPSRNTSSEIKADLLFLERGLVVKPGVINAGEAFSMTLIVQGKPQKLNIHGRILGVKKINEPHILTGKIVSWSIFLGPPIAAYIAFGYFLIIASLDVQASMPEWMRSFYGWLGALAMMIAVIVAIFKFVRFKSRLAKYFRFGV